MESLVLQTKTSLHRDSTQTPVHTVEGVPSGTGGRGKTLKDMRILEELQQYGIISHIYPW